MKFKVGDQVNAIDDDVTGRVVRINESLLYVETSEGFELEFTEDQLIKMEDATDLLSQFNQDLISEKIHSDITPNKKTSNRIKKKERYEPMMEVDLHSHKLLKSEKGLTKHDILTYQLDTARHKLEYAIKKNIQRIVFIHGVGEGVLKLELEYLFGRYENIKYFDANYQKYGVGATEVYVYQNAKRRL